MNRSTMNDKPKTFKQTLDRIEHIVQEIEQGNVELETSVERFEEGMKLIARARSILESAEKKIQKLQTDADGAPVLENFDPGETDRSS